ncbi:acyltransferase [Leucobacter iarius]|uniref:Acyltransferase n=1 Tax=Leucobacter iarius TaxID=333963 RepID=A0ABP4XIZ6_9MICO
MLPPTRPRLDSLTGLRWWAAFGVFIFHMRVFAPVPVLNAFAPVGNAGVAFFFVLSGFVLTWSAVKPTTVRNFYWRRFARIWPANLVALLLAIPVFYQLFPGEPVQSWMKPLDIGLLVLAALLLQGWSSNPAVLFAGNPAAWTLTVEAFFYAVHPWVLRILNRIGRRGIVIFTVAVPLAAFAYRALVAYGPAGWWSQLPLPITRVSEFLLGMGIALLLRAGRRIGVRPFWAFALLGVYVLGRIVGGRLGIAALEPVLALTGRFDNEIMVVLFGIIIWAVAQRDLDGGRSALRHPVMVKLGEWSFAFYLVHATAMYAVMAFAGHQRGSWSNLVWYPIVLAISLLLAWALYRFVEHPLERRMRRWGDARLTGSVPPRATAARAGEPDPAQREGSAASAPSSTGSSTPTPPTR